MEILILAQNLKLLRANKGVSQAEIAASIGVSRQNYFNWENGASYPSIDALRKLSVYFELLESDLINVDLSEADLIDLQNDWKKRNNTDLNTDLLTDLIPNLHPSGTLVTEEGSHYQALSKKAHFPPDPRDIAIQALQGQVKALQTALELCLQANKALQTTR